VQLQLQQAAATTAAAATRTKNNKDDSEKVQQTNVKGLNCLPLILSVLNVIASV